MRKEYLKGEDIETIYFGGGTPSQLEKEDFEQIFDTIRTHYGLSHCQEITLEANPDDLTIIMRRYMMKIAEAFARQDKCLGLITGESIGQVASQTMHSLAVTNEVCTMPVFRPLIGFDKQEIVDISEKIGTYETSVLPYEDCCTIFVAKHPVTKPNLNVIKCSERHLDDVIDEMMERAVSTAETIEVC